MMVLIVVLLVLILFAILTPEKEREGAVLGMLACAGAILFLAYIGPLILGGLYLAGKSSWGWLLFPLAFVLVCV